MSAIVKNYTRALPQEISKTATRSFLYSSAATLLLWRNPVLAVFNGATNAVGSLAEAAVRPIFDKIFGVTQSKSWVHHLTEIMVMVLAQDLFILAAAPIIGGSVQIHLVASIVMIFACTILQLPGFAEGDPKNIPYTQVFLYT